MAIITVYVLTCQECGHEEIRNTPNKNGTVVCGNKRCRSESYDYGSGRGYDTTTQKLIEYNEEDEL